MDYFPFDKVFVCYFIETDNENPIYSIIIHETSERVGIKMHGVELYVLIFVALRYPIRIQPLIYWVASYD